MIDVVRIPEARKAVLIGKNGSTKKKIEKSTGVSIEVDEGVVIEGEALGVFTASKMVKAIGRGFTPQEATALLTEDFDLYIMPVSGTKKRRETKIARLIGRQGSAKDQLEEYTGAKIAVQGKTVAVIGTYTEISNAVRAIEDLLAGSRHASVYKHAIKRKAKDKSLAL